MKIIAKRDRFSTYRCFPSSIAADDGDYRRARASFTYRPGQTNGQWTVKCCCLFRFSKSQSPPCEIPLHRLNCSHVHRFIPVLSRNGSGLTADETDYADATLSRAVTALAAPKTTSAAARRRRHQQQPPPSLPPSSQDHHYELTPPVQAKTARLRKMWRARFVEWGAYYILSATRRCF